MKLELFIENWEIMLSNEKLVIPIYFIQYMRSTRFICLTYMNPYGWNLLEKLKNSKCSQTSSVGCSWGDGPPRWGFQVASCYSNQSQGYLTRVSSLLTASPTQKRSHGHGMVVSNLQLSP